MASSSDGREHVAGYSFAGDFICAFPAFDGEATAVSIQAIKESTVYFVKLDFIHSHQSWEYRYKIAYISLTDTYGKLLDAHRDPGGEVP